MWRFVPVPCLALSRVLNLDRSRKVPSSSGGIFSLVPAVGFPLRSTLDARLEELDMTASLFCLSKKVTRASFLSSAKRPAATLSMDSMSSWQRSSSQMARVLCRNSPTLSHISSSVPPSMGQSRTDRLANSYSGLRTAGCSVTIVAPPPRSNTTTRHDNWESSALWASEAVVSEVMEEELVAILPALSSIRW